MARFLAKVGLLLPRIFVVCPAAATTDLKAVEQLVPADA
jgi:hypothetical protein